MSLASFGHLPTGILGHPVPFTLHVPGSSIHTLNTLVQHAHIAAPSFYNTNADPTNGTFGISRDWLITAQEIWTDPKLFSWRAHEKHQNRFPQWKINITVPSDQEVFQLHFAAFFSKKKSAIPITLLHGWPGSWSEFAEVLELLATKYTPETLPYHVIVPSIPDYGLSTRPQEIMGAGEVTMERASEALNELMKALGFKRYVAQGGDVGSFLAQTMCGLFDECRAFHLNMLFLTANQSAEVANIPITPEEEKQQEFVNAWAQTGSAYAVEHGTRPSTISLVLNTNPLAMLTWMGEKFIEWSDNRYPLSLNAILAQVSFYWFTDSYSHSMWAYRALTRVVGGPLPPMPMSMTKPFGFSAFPVELATVPHAWAKHLFPNLVFYGKPGKGGHFAALQAPEEFLGEIEGFLKVIESAVMTS